MPAADAGRTRLWPSADRLNALYGWALINQRRLLSGALALVVIVGVLAGALVAYQRRSAGQALPSKLTIETSPPGLDVAIDGESRGRTPVTLDLPPRTYVVQIGSGAQQRIIQATVSPGVTLVERVEVPAAAVTGTLRVETEPSGLPVMVNGVNKGKSPLTIAQMTPGDYQVAAGAGKLSQRRVSIAPNETVSVIISTVEPPAASTGWLVVTSPLLLQLREGGKVIGSTDMERVMLPAGEHTLELVNDALEFRVTRRLSIAPGKTERVALEVPEGTLSINALPWADVWLDGRSVGTTPIGNVVTTIGSHEVVFRHPDLGERRATVSVRAKTPARIGIDMRGK